MLPVDDKGISIRTDSVEIVFKRGWRCNMLFPVSIAWQCATYDYARLELS